MDDFYDTSYVKRGRDGRRPRLCVTYHDAGGKRRERSRAAEPKRMSALRREAEEWRAELNERWRAERAEEEESRRREEAEAKVPTLPECVRDFIDERLADGIERSTLRGYLRRARLVLDPDGPLAGVRIDRVDPESCKAWMRHLLVERGLSPVTVAAALGLLRSALGRAVDHGDIPSNPARKVKTPRRPGGAPNALDRPSVARLEAWIGEGKGDWFSTFVAIALYTGMREGEISALRWRDVDMARGEIRVRHAIGRSDDGDYLKSTKNGMPRTVGVPVELARVLGRRRDAMFAEQVDLHEDEAPMRMPELYVCGHSDGTWQSPQVVSGRWRRLRRRLGLRGFERDRCPFHDLRHTYITYMLNAGVPVLKVASIVGHSSAAMTLDVYASVDPESVLEAARSIGDVYGAACAGEIATAEPVYELPSGDE